MKTSILSALFLFMGFFCFSQFKNQNEYFLVGSDTIGKITKITCKTCKVNPLINLDSTSFFNQMDVDIRLNKLLTTEEKNKINTIFFNSNAKINFTENFEQPQIEVNQLYTESITQQSQMVDLQRRLNLSSEYLVKSANQKNVGMLVGLAGSLVTGLFIASDNPNRTKLALGTAVITGGAVLVIEISANENQKKAGLSLKL